MISSLGGLPRRQEKHRVCPHSPPDKDVANAAGEVAHFTGLRHPTQPEQGLLFLALLPPVAVWSSLSGSLKLVVNVNPDPATETSFLPEGERLV